MVLAVADVHETNTRFQEGMARLVQASGCRPGQFHDLSCVVGGVGKLDQVAGGVEVRLKW